MASSNPKPILGNGWYVEISSSKISQFTNMTFTLRDSQNGSELIEIYKEDEYFDSFGLENDNSFTYRFGEYGYYTIFNGNGSVTQWTVEKSYFNFMNIERLFVNGGEIRKLEDSLGQILFNNTNISATQYLFDYLTDIDDYYAQSLPNDTMGCGSTDSMSVTENDELLISDYQTRVFRNNTFTSSNHYVLELDLKKPNGIYRGADFEVMIGEPSKFIKFDSGYYGEFIQYLLEENGTEQEVSYRTTSDRFTDYFTLRITRDGNAWKGEWIVNDTVLRTLEATTPLDISNKLGFCSYSWHNYNSDELYVKNIKITYY